MHDAAVKTEPLSDIIERLRKIEAEPLPANLGALLDEAARDDPGKIALNFFEVDEKITYRELADRTRSLASGLSQIGVQKGSRVVVMLPNIAAFPITWLALARLGAVMVPVNARYTPRELNFVVTDSRSTFLVLHADYLPLLDAISEAHPDLGNHLIRVGGAGRGLDWTGLVQTREPMPAGEVRHDDLLNIQYTSGTTGFPKGCMLTHLYWLTIGKSYAWRDGIRYSNILATTPFFYLDPQWLLAMSFFHRATLHVAARQSVSRFMDWVRAYRINFCLFPEPVFKQPASPHDRENELIRGSMMAVSPQLHHAIEQRFGFAARESYGMTEIGGGLFMPVHETEMVGSGACGIPMPFRQCRVVDSDCNDVPVGKVGELIVTGPGMMLGYYRNEAATAASFHGSWFRTGDLFRKDERGFFYMVGRAKDMVRRAGENIAAAEVEAVLRELPEVQEVAVIPVPDDMRDEEVKAYIVLRPGAYPEDLPLDRLFRHCADKLAPFKVPRYIEYRTDPLPKTASEKISKPALIAERQDLRATSWDRVEKRWR